MIITRDEAKALGLKRFFTGEPCANEHVAERFVHNGGCRQCNIEKLRAMYARDREVTRKKWREQSAVKKAKNPERVKENGRKAMKRLRDKKTVAERREEWRRQYYERTAKAGHEAINAVRRKRYEKDPTQALATNHVWRAKRMATGGKLKGADLKKMYVRQRAMCAYDFCKKSLTDGYHIDHIVPLVLGGSSDRRNIQLLCPTCNTRKGGKHPIEFAQQNGMLL